MFPSRVVLFSLPPSHRQVFPIPKRKRTAETEKICTHEHIGNSTFYAIDLPESLHHTRRFVVPFPVLQLLDEKKKLKKYDGEGKAGRPLALSALSGVWATDVG